MEESSRPAFSVIIVNYFSGLLTKACVNSIRKTCPGNDYEIFVVDNASTDDSRDIIRTEMPGVAYHFSDKNLGFAKAVNIGIQKTRGKYVIVLNPDVIVLEHGIQALTAFMEKNPKAGIAAGRLINPNGTVQESISSFYTPLTILYRRTFLGRFGFAKKALEKAFMRGEDIKGPKEIDWAIGACLCARRAAVETVGLMDERFFMYFEDMDWCRRFREKDWGVWYVPEARFAHYHKRESAKDRGLLALFNPLARIHIASGIKYFMKYKGEFRPKPRP